MHGVAEGAVFRLVGEQLRVVDETGGVLVDFHEGKIRNDSG
jgi:hypothetical protein